MKRNTIVVLALVVMAIVVTTAPVAAQIHQPIAKNVAAKATYIPQVYVFGTVSAMPNLSWEDQMEAFKKARIEVFRKNADKTENLVGRTLDCRTQYGEGTPTGCVSDYGQFWFGSVLGAKEYIVRVFMPGGYAEKTVQPENGQLEVNVDLVEIALKGTVQVLRVSKTSATVVYSLRNDSDWYFYVNVDADLVTGATTASEMVIPCSSRECSLKSAQIEPGGDYSWFQKWDLNKIPELNYLRQGATVQVRLRATHSYWRDLVWVDVSDEFENPRGFVLPVMTK